MNGSDAVKNTVGSAILERRATLGMTLQNLAEQAGCARSYLSMIEQGRRTSPPSDALLGRLEAALRLPAGTLVSLAHWHNTPAPVRRRVEALEGERRAAAAQLRELIAAPRTQTPSRVLDDLWRTGKLRELVGRMEASGREPTNASLERSLVAHRAVEIPLINSVAAGYPRDFTDMGYPARTADSYVRSPDIADPDAFACRVVGDSMSPDYREGDIVVFSPARDVKDGMDCFVRLEPDHETTFKRVYFLAQPHPPDTKEVPGGASASPTDMTHIRLHPLNPAYPTRTVPREHVAGLYPAVSVTRTLM